MSAKPGNKPVPWTPEQDTELREIWKTNKRIKANMDLFGDHTYAAIMTRAYELGLGRRPACQRGQSPIAWTLIERELRKQPANRYRLSDVLKLHPATAHKELNAKRDAGLVHICRWERRSKTSAHVPVYALGPGLDVPKPAALTANEKQRRSRTHEKQQRLLGGTPVKGINPFLTAVGLTVVPDGPRGRVFKQDMSIRDDEDLAA
ncbi:hypothetical protein [Burkholderia ubonensis]|uniref:hypothetical protein n=1 Tax=Burkholderia ubonensis TaxID=101571 RepID=UPI000AA1FA6F|nr:hypothetical protein [Burkholderia ubonensis]